MKFLPLILLSLLLIGCDRVDKPSAEIRLQKLFPNCQIWENPRLQDEIRLSGYIIKTTDGKIYYIEFFAGGMRDPVECFPTKIEK